MHLVGEMAEWWSGLFGGDDYEKRSHAVADHVLYLRQRAGVDTTPMHILKIVYMCHGWMLAVNDNPLLAEPVEAWTYGPVIPTIYHRYKRYVAQSILEEAQDHGVELGDPARELVAVIEEVYRPYSAAKLSAMTHRPGTPWDVTRRRHGIGAIIDNALIQEHFEALRARSEGAAVGA